MTIQMTGEEWKSIHKDFKCVLDGQRYKLGHIPGKEGLGTALVPVEIIKEKGAI